MKKSISMFPQQAEQDKADKIKFHILAELTGANDIIKANHNLDKDEVCLILSKQGYKAFDGVLHVSSGSFAAQVCINWSYPDYRTTLDNVETEIDTVIKDIEKEWTNNGYYAQRKKMHPHGYQIDADVWVSTSTKNKLSWDKPVTKHEYKPSKYGHYNYCRLFDSFVALEAKQKEFLETAKGNVDNCDKSLKYDKLRAYFKNKYKVIELETAEVLKYGKDLEWNEIKLSNEADKNEAISKLIQDNEAFFKDESFSKLSILKLFRMFAADPINDLPKFKILLQAQTLHNTFEENNQTFVLSLEDYINDKESDLKNQSENLEAKYNSKRNLKNPSHRERQKVQHLEYNIRRHKNELAYLYSNKEALQTLLDTIVL